MQLVRTTLRIRSDLKKKAQKKAIDEDTTLQAVFNRALEEHLKKTERKKSAKKLTIPSIDLGAPLDNLTRDDIYGDPDPTYSR